MIKIIHTADTHFGVENYGKLNSKTGLHSRLLDFKDSFDQIVDFTISNKADLFLFCGDAYKTAYPTPTQQKLFLQSLMQLYNAKIPVVIIVGNHDHPLSFGKANSLDIFRQLPLSGFHVFSKPDFINLQTKNGPLQIVGIPWPIKNNIVAQDKFHLKTHNEITSYISNTVGQIIQTFADKLDPQIPSILAGHLTVSNAVFSGSEKTAIFGKDPVFLPSQLAIKPFDYVALGHLHRHQNLNPKGYPAVVYSGSSERIDFGERKEEKGFCQILIHRYKFSNENSLETLSPNKSYHKKKNPFALSPELDEVSECSAERLSRCSFEFIKLKTRPMIQLEVKLKTKDEANGKNQTEQILEKINETDIKDSILKIIYHVPEGKTDKVDLAQIQQACKIAMQLVCITPVIKHAVRQRRASLQVDMDIKTLVSGYLQTKENLKFDKGKILSKAMQLYEELNQISDK